METNPDPEQVCGLCEREVEINSKCLCCNHCCQCLHSECVGMSDEMYAVLSNQTSFSWVCCSYALPNFSSTFFMSNPSLDISNSFDMFEDTQTTESDTYPDTSVSFHGAPVATSTPTKNSGENNKPKPSGRTRARKLKSDANKLGRPEGIRKRQNFEAEINHRTTSTGHNFWMRVQAG